MKSLLPLLLTLLTLALPGRLALAGLLVALHETPRDRLYR